MLWNARKCAIVAKMMGRSILAALALGALLGRPVASAAVQPNVAEQAPTAPDYADPQSWAAGPAGPGAAAAVPAGATPLARKASVDVFYVNPTTYRSDSRWNQDIADQAANAWTDASVIARQASVFNGCCRIFAPRYRQASYLALGSKANRDAAFALAYGDVERAFDWFLAHESKGRPFILAAHSQGGAHIAELLEKRIDGTPLADRMVAAYVIGINLAEGDFGHRYKHIKPCDMPRQTGCILQWNAELAGSDISALAARYEQAYIDKYCEDTGKTTLCINPVTFDRKKPTSTARQSKGAVPGDPGMGPVHPLVAHAVAARCENGLLVVDPAPSLELKPLPGGVMHYHDYGLFYADIRANVTQRIVAYFKTHRSKP